MSTATATAARRAAHDTEVPARAQGVELLGQVTGSGYARTPSLVRRRDGQILQLTPTLYAALEAIDGRRDHAGIAARLRDTHGVVVGPDDVAFLIEEKLRPLGVLRGTDGEEPATRTANPLLALRCRVVITDPAITDRVTRPFAWLFTPSVALAVTVAFFVTSGWLLFERGLGAATHQVLYEPALLLTVFALTMVSAGFHELGHAAACRYGGARPGTMGVGLYLVWPAFYTDVSDSYRLGRRGRLRVDLGGLYFNAVFAVGAFVAWAITGSDALLVIVPLQHLQMLRQLGPFVRLDGYHILADLTGVPDLFARIRPALASLLPHKWGSPEAKALKPWARAVVTAWVLVVVPVLLLALLLMLVSFPRLVATAWDSLRLQWAGVGEAWSGGDLAGIGLGVVSVLAVATPVLSGTYLLTRIGRRTGRRIWRASDGNPPMRVATVLGLAALVLAAAAAWWPHGQYVPIAEHERGTIGDGARALVRADTAEPVLTSFVEGGDELAAAVPAALEDAGFDPSAVRVVVPLPDITLSPERYEFALPEAPGEGDNQALAVNDADGSSVFEASFSLVWVLDGTADNRNEAYALASCRDCETSALAFQLVLVVGDAEYVVPENAAVAINALCDRCVTQALARQLIVTLAEPPTPETAAALALIWDRIDALESAAPELGLAATQAALADAEREILELLAPHATSITRAGDDATTSTTAGSSTSTSTSTPTSLAPSTTATTTPSTTTTTTSADDPTTTTETTEPPTTEATTTTAAPPPATAS